MDTQGNAALVGDQIEDAQAEQVMDMLEEHVPLSLLMDLTAPTGPDSRAILEAEGVPEQHWWEQG
ncbi:hypothetical protein [Angustibacter aerolatus]|uniref:Uncharacterized protein n=1 Tax=Angustibacter aerolatus TaxID=1162965 RepID=A0ABQ6JCE3_9ACTN|nr:hypothetical protein [Angustibacter aerolatus]GMA85842.1 hypothetical protein GCM10025868_10920 [Angustibacter aerolatus]